MKTILLFIFSLLLCVSFSQDKLVFKITADKDDDCELHFDLKDLSQDSTYRLVRYKIQGIKKRHLEMVKNQLSFSRGMEISTEFSWWCQYASALDFKNKYLLSRITIERNSLIPHACEISFDFEELPKCSSSKSSR